MKFKSFYVIFKYKYYFQNVLGNRFENYKFKP